MDINDLEKWFNRPLPDNLRLNDYEYITDVKKSVETKINILKSNPNNRAYLPYYKELVKIKRAIEKSSS